MNEPTKRFPNDKSGQLFDFLREKYKLSSDKELSQRINVLPYVISKIRNGKQGVSKPNKHDISVSTGMSIKKIDDLIGEGSK